MLVYGISLIQESVYSMLKQALQCEQVTMETLRRGSQCITQLKDIQLPDNSHYIADCSDVQRCYGHDGNSNLDCGFNRTELSCPVIFEGSNTDLDDGSDVETCDFDSDDDWDTDTDSDDEKTWKKPQPVTEEEMEERAELTAEDLIQKMKDGVEVTFEEYERLDGLLYDELSKARRKGDYVRSNKLLEQGIKLNDAYFGADQRRREQEKKIQEEADKIKKEAWKIKAETEALPQKTDADQQVLETTEFVKNMTEEILEQKKRLSQKNVELERTGKHKMDNTSGKETYRDIQIHLRNITGLVQVKMQNLSEEVRKRLELFMSAFRKLLAGIWKLLFIVLMLGELEKLLASLLLGDIYTSSRKRRLKYGFKMAAMLALWLSHDVESNPGPSFDRTPLEKIIRQLSEVLRYHLPVGGSLWSESVAEAAYAAGYSPDFKWNNPSGPNKDSVSKLTARAAELGRLLSGMDCLPAEFAPFVFTLDQNEALEQLRNHYRVEAYMIAVDGLLQADSFTDRQITLIVQQTGRVNKKLFDFQHQRSHQHAAVVGGDRENPPSPDFGILADSNTACASMPQHCTAAYPDKSLTTGQAPKGDAVSSDKATVDHSGMIPSCLVTDSEVADETTNQDPHLQITIDALSPQESLDNGTLSSLFPSVSNQMTQADDTVDLRSLDVSELLKILGGLEQQTLDILDENSVNATKPTSLIGFETFQVQVTQQDPLQTETKTSSNGKERAQKEVDQEHGNTEDGHCRGILQSMPGNQHSLADSSHSLDHHKGDVSFTAMTMCIRDENITPEDPRRTQLTDDSSVSKTWGASKIGNDRNTSEMENTIVSMSKSMNQTPLPFESNQMSKHHRGNDNNDPRKQQDITESERITTHNFQDMIDTCQNVEEREVQIMLDQQQGGKNGRNISVTNGMGQDAEEDMEEKESVSSNKYIGTVESQQKKKKMTSVTTCTEDSQNQPGIATQTIEGTNTCNGSSFDLMTGSMGGTFRYQAGGIQERNLLVNFKASLLKDVENYIDNRLRNFETVLTAPNQQNQTEREYMEEIQQGTGRETEKEETAGGLSQAEPPLISRKRKRRYSVRRAKKPK